MNQKKIEKLLVLLTVAVIAKFLYGVAYQSFDFSNQTLFGIPKGIKDISDAFINFAIAYWLYTVISTKQLCWVVLGLFFKWWALPLYAYYVYVSANEKENT